MNHNDKSILSIFVRYVFFAILFLLMLKIFCEYYFFEKFNFRILDVIDFAEVVYSEIGISYGQQVAVIVILPLMITAIFVLQCWITDALPVIVSRYIVFLFGILPLASILFYVNDINLTLLWVICLFFFFTCIIFWIVLFQVRRFELAYVSIHFFFTCSFLIGINSVHRMDIKIRERLNSSTQVMEIKPAKITQRVIFVSNTDLYDLFYIPSQHRCIVIPKRN